MDAIGKPQTGLVIHVPQKGQVDGKMHRGHDAARGGDHVPQICAGTNTGFLAEVLGPLKSIQFLSRTAWHRGGSERVGEGAASLFVQAAHEAFTDHIPFVLRPEVLWYIIVHEVSILVKSEPKKYASLFHGDPTTQKLIQVRDDSLIYNGHSNWGRSLQLFRDHLTRHMGPALLDLFLPRFTTSTDESEVALLVTFMDTVSRYYNYAMLTLCHIPAFKLEGPLSDWELLKDQTKALRDRFDELRAYFDALLPVIEKVCTTVRHGSGDADFWRSFYKLHDASGGPYVTGWITAFFAYVATGRGEYEPKAYFDWRRLVDSTWGPHTTFNVPSHVTKVPFSWDYYDTAIPMLFVSGVLGVDDDNGFLAPRLGFAVVEPHLHPEVIASGGTHILGKPFS